MTDLSRRSLLAGLGAASLAGLPPAIARAAAIAPDVRKGTIEDIQHVVILMQENRSFDHYFGALRGVRGFADRHPIPLAPLPGEDSPRKVWEQYDGKAQGGPRAVGPFHLSTKADFDLIRMAGTPHTWPDAQAAWDEGRLSRWPEAKSQRAMGHYRREDIPFQYALAETFTICDAYHCSIQTGTNSNRLFLWSGSNGPDGTTGGPSIDNSHDSFPEDGGAADSYGWTTVVERLQAAGIDWRIYQDMADNFTDNPLVGFASFRASHKGQGDPELKARAMSTQALDALRRDVLAGTLPQVSYIIGTASGSEHPAPSSPAQGAAYTADVLDALTADPKVWARTALFVMFDENDGFFDHMPPPAPPSHGADGEALGGSTVDLAGEYHVHPSTGDPAGDPADLRGRPYGLGPRVPMYVVSPWSRGGWVNSEVFDHTSVTRFLEARFGLHDKEISPWRRAVCGDLTSTFDFTGADRSPFGPLPDPRPEAMRAAAVPHQVKPLAPVTREALWQEPGQRPSRPLDYDLDVTDRLSDNGIGLRFIAKGTRGAVFHVYDRHDLASPPRRYTVEAGKALEGEWRFARTGGYDLEVFGPNGFHRRFAGTGASAPAMVRWQLSPETVHLEIVARKPGVTLERAARADRPREAPVHFETGAHRLSLRSVQGWYDFTLDDGKGWHRRIAGRLDRPGVPSTSDPFAV
ncbi:phosphocholine-specific phospholipase C [Novosphingobium sp. 9]|uniref:phosphocholine-specific phospholipase C n=1 Tax=Novosphingobium sp. 9 TaxID=2025349 RepID=UPI0021B4D94C|nr:phospholipase C, phosphocholine-specific [Novosphingobium sp. 9]